jgi:hypothetical protein
MKTQKIFLAGPMTGLPDHNFPAFDEAAANLRGAGYTVYNPAENSHSADGSWAGYVKTGIRYLMTCDAVALLPGWEASKGARFEGTIAGTLGMPTKPLHEWLNAGRIAHADPAAWITAEPVEELDIDSTDALMGRLTSLRSRRDTLAGLVGSGSREFEKVRADLIAHQDQLRAVNAEITAVRMRLDERSREIADLLAAGEPDGQGASLWPPPP